MRKYLSVIALALIVAACAKVEIGSLAMSKVSHASLESWNSHILGMYSQEVKAQTMIPQDWKDYRWHRNFDDKLRGWQNLHNLYLDLAGQEVLTPADEQRLISLGNQLIALINQIRNEAIEEGYHE